jgi:hypothetical protein
VRGIAPPVCEQTSPAPNSAATSGSRGSAPAQVSLIRSAPGVHAEQLLGVGAAQPFDERHHPGDLLVGADVLAGPGLDAADVDDVAAVGDGLVRRGLGGVVAECRTAVEEGVRGAVDDRHDQRPIGRHRLAQERR